MKTTRFFLFFRDTFLKISLPILLTASFSLSEMRTQAQISLTPSNTVYTQNFDAFLGTAASVTNDLPGWTVSGNTPIGRNCGSMTNGGMYAFGNPGDYSLGFLPTSSAPNNSYSARVTFQNNTGATITEVEISYNFERWRPATRLNGFTVTSNLGNVSALNQNGTGSTGSNCTVITTAKSVTLTGLNVANGATFYIEFSGDRGEGSGSSQGVAIDDFRIEVTTEAPAAQLSAGTLATFGAWCLGSISTEQSFTASGSALSGNITVTAPSGYSLSSVSGGPYTAALSLTPSSGTLNEQVYVVFEPVLVQSYSGHITLSGGGATTVNVGVSGAGDSANPSISISSNAGTESCAGTEITFTASVADEGANPVYQWKINGNDVGTNSAAFSSSSLNDGDVVSCELTSDAACADGNAVASNQLTVAILPSVIPTLFIVSDAPAAVCEGTEITFTASAADEGANPVYQWKINGIDAGTNSITFSSSTLQDDEVVSCELSSDAQCAVLPVLSNEITVTITAVVVPSVTISAVPGVSVSSGETVTFTATAANEGINPVYQWLLNGANVGSNSATYVNSTLRNGDEVSCILYSDAACTVPDSALSNTLEIAVSSGIGTFDKASFSVLAYPNPGDGNVTLQGTFPAFSRSPLNIEVYTIAGQLMYSETVPVNGGTLNHYLDLTALRNGLYLIRVSQQEEMQVLRITIGR